MKEIAIYVEGGGDTAQQKAEIRAGFDVLLKAQKDAARGKRLRWRLIPSGGRQQTYDAFINEVARADDDMLCILLVDSEVPIEGEVSGKPERNAQVRKTHLAQRDGWDLSPIDSSSIHLMVQCMESWVVADPLALAGFYGKGFREANLPVRQNLEEEPKDNLLSKLDLATRDSQKGIYAKIRHASKLLALISASKVSYRCIRFRTFTTWLTSRIGAA